MGGEVNGIRVDVGVVVAIALNIHTFCSVTIKANMQREVCLDFPKHTPKNVGDQTDTMGR